MDENDLIKNETISTSKEKNDIKNSYMTLGAGFTTNKNLNFIHLTYDLVLSKNTSLFIATGPSP